MKRVRGILTMVLLAGVLAWSSNAAACTVFSLVRDGQVWFGTNEDWPDPVSTFWCVPASAGKYGRVYFGFGRGLPQGGINERGLCFDFAAVPFETYVVNPEKPSCERFLAEKIMEECSSVAEALDTLLRYNFELLGRTQMLLADRNGVSALIESDTVIIHRAGVQVMTNFRHSAGENEPYSIDRWRTAGEILSKDVATIDLVKSALAATHQETGSPTQYSVAYDLLSGDIYLWHFHNFADHVKLNVREELAKGDHEAEICSMFPYTPTAADKYHNENKRPERKEVAVDPSTLLRLTGRYEVVPEMVLNIINSGDSLLCRITGFSSFRLRPASKNNYFFKELPIEVEFVVPEAGRPDSLLLRFAGSEMVARRKP